MLNIPTDTKEWVYPDWLFLIVRLIRQEFVVDRLDEVRKSTAIIPGEFCVFILERKTGRFNRIAFPKR